MLRRAGYSWVIVGCLLGLQLGSAGCLFGLYLGSTGRAISSAVPDIDTTLYAVPSLLPGLPGARLFDESDNTNFLMY